MPASDGKLPLKMNNINSPTITTNDIVRPTVVEVDLARLRANFQNIQRHVGGSQIMPMLKANAYGHGIVRVAQLMESLGADYLGVAVLEEGMLLREHGIRLPILVCGGIMGNQIPYFLKHDLTITASSIEKLQQIDSEAAALGKRARVHLKVDTGMERIGVHYYSAAGLLEASLACKHCDVEGIYSHFASSDSADLTYARLQMERFEEVLQFYLRRDLPMPMRHMANSGSILQLPEANYDLVRPGILLYGVYPSDHVRHSVDVEPALTWKSHVVYFKVVKPGHPVSYGSTWQSDQMVRVVTVPVGYGDGYFRALSNNAEVIIRGKKYPVVGVVCMDQIMVNIGWESAYNGDEVVLIGHRDGVQISCEDLARRAGTIPYEVLTNINTRVPRIYLSSDPTP